MRGHEPVVDAQPGQLGAHEPPERVITDTRDQRRPVTQPRRCDRDIGGATAQELPERLDVLESDPHLQRVHIHAASPDGEHVVDGSRAGCLVVG